MRTENIRIFREMFGLSQEFVASQIGISHTAYAKIERGETKITWLRLTQICKVIEVSTKTVLEFDKEKFKVVK